MKKKLTTNDCVLEAERRFKAVSGIREDISIYPLHQRSDTSTETNKSKSKEFGEVFTPLWLVDEMINQVEINPNTTTLDLCAGYGQFSIRLMRKLANQPGFNYKNFICGTHSFCELQLSSCYKLIKTFTNKLNLFIGDAKQLASLPGVASGIWVYVESMKSWVPITHTVEKLMYPCYPDCKILTSEEDFCKQLQLIIDDLNKAFDMNKNEFIQYYLGIDSQTRLHFLGLINRDMNATHSDDEHITTPPSVVRDMLACVDDLDKKNILVLFNAEYVEQLIHAKKIDPNRIIFGVDARDKLRAAFVKKTYGVESVVFSDRDPKHIVQALGKKRWDVVLSNPPYNRGLDLKILQAMLDNNVAKEYVIVHPSTWLLDQKGKTNLYGSIKSLLSSKIRSIKLFNGNTIFGISLMLPVTITHIDVEYNNSTTKVKFFDEEFDVNNIDDITKFGKSWLSLVKPFVAKIEKSIVTNGQVWSHNTRTIEDNKKYCQLAAIRGHESYDTVSMVKDDFYTMTVDIDTCKGIRQPNLNRPGNPTPTFGFETTTERDNFLQYVNTDFARFCLAVYKNNSNLAVGEMELIPWLDFTQAWDDDKLFAHFNINQETQDYIRSFLPDYYGIRKNKTKSAA